jgi:hypothetical protein
LSHCSPRPIRTHPGQIHRGWYFEIAMGAAAALAILLRRPRKAVDRAA